MRKILLAAIAAAAVIVPASAASATEGKVKVTICHWANGHPHAISVSVNAVAGDDTGHGLLTLVDDVLGLDSHDTPGHEGDTFLHLGAEIKKVEDGELTDDEKCADLVEPPKDGKDGTNGVDGKDGLNGKDGTNGKNGKDGLNGKDGVSVNLGEIDRLNAIVTELNNRLFILESRPQLITSISPPAPSIPVAQPASSGELPHTGSTTLPLIGIAFLLILLGTGFRAARRSLR